MDTPKFNEHKFESRDENSRSVTPRENISFQSRRSSKNIDKFLDKATIPLFCYAIKSLWSISKDKAHTDEKIRLNTTETDNKIRYDNAHAENIMRIENNRSKNKIEELKAKSEYLKLKKQIQSTGKTEVNTYSVKPSEWISKFETKFSTPDFTKIPMLGEIISGCPDRYKVPMALHLLTAMGALCFSRVRAPYLDNRNHAPNLLLIIEGESGSGKSYFNTIYQTIFSEIIEEDRIKYANRDTNTIISTAGIDISATQFATLLANNKGVHNFIMETEFSTIADVFSRTSGLSPAILRKAFDNEAFFRNRVGKDQSNGPFNVFMNCSFTGTPQAINNFFNDKEVEGGTARRFCFSLIPETGREAPYFKFPQGKELAEIQKKIKSWRQTYCFYNTPEKGDTPCDENILDLGYINKALNEWQCKQYDHYLIDGILERKNYRSSIATIAFHYAIVLHMLFVNSNMSKEKKNRVTDLTLYIANYCMERYIAKFSSSKAIESNNSIEPTIVADTEEDSMLEIPDELLEYWSKLQGSTDENGKTIGYGTIAKNLGITKDQARNALIRYRKKKNQ